MERSPPVTDLATGSIGAHCPLRTYERQSPDRKVDDERELRDQTEADGDAAEDRVAPRRLLEPDRESVQRQRGHRHRGTVGRRQSRVGEHRRQCPERRECDQRGRVAKQASGPHRYHHQRDEEERQIAGPRSDDLVPAADAARDGLEDTRERRMLHVALVRPLFQPLPPRPDVRRLVERPAEDVPRRRHARHRKEREQHEGNGRQSALHASTTDTSAA